MKETQASSEGRGRRRCGRVCGVNVLLRPAAGLGCDAQRRFDCGVSRHAQRGQMTGARHALGRRRPFVVARTRGRRCRPVVRAHVRIVHDRGPFRAPVRRPGREANALRVLVVGSTSRVKPAWGAHSLRDAAIGRSLSAIRRLRAPSCGWHRRCSCRQRWFSRGEACESGRSGSSALRGRCRLVARGLRLGLN